MKIGVIDSGIGGLTLLKKLLTTDADFFYCSDGQNVPYGEKPQAFIKKRIESMVAELLEKKVKGIVIACNTATAETINSLRKNYSIPFVGIEPYINYLHTNTQTENEKIGLILTEATFQSERFRALREKLDPNNKIDIYPLKKLAILIESLKRKPFKEIESDINEELGPLKGKEYQKLILGCTHYPIISEHIASVLNCNIIDPTQNVVNRVIDVFELSSSDKVKNFGYSEDCGKTWVQAKIEDFFYL